MALPPAGWYDDPADSEQLRWWTGEGWSEFRERTVTGFAAAAEVHPVEVPVAETVVAEPAVAEPAVPLPYGPAAVTGAAGASAVPAEPVGVPAVPPFAASRVPAPAPAPARVAAAEVSRFRQVRQLNPLAFTGVLVGLAALVFNPLGGPGLLAIIFGVMGVVRSSDLSRRGAAVTGVGWAVAALVIGAVVAVKLVSGYLPMFR